MANRRRARYTVTTADGQRHVILAYSTEGARLFYKQKGHTVTRVQTGDYRITERNAEISAQGGYHINHAAIRDACEHLGVKLPVKIRQHGRVGNTHGNHRFNGSFHNIMVKSYLTPEQASHTLWHELTHAMQVERSGGTKESWSRECRAQSIYSYRIRPMEREANAMADSMTNFPLTTR
jgi:hypothetical protein